MVSKKVAPAAWRNRLLLAVLLTATLLHLAAPTAAQTVVKPAPTPRPQRTDLPPRTAPAPAAATATTPAPAPTSATAPAAQPATTTSVATPATDSQAKKPLAYQLGPVPSWVSEVAAPERDASMARAPMHYRVIDEQLRAVDRSMSEFSRVIRVVNQVGGLATAAQFELEFDPSYQTLVLHRLRAWRGGQWIDKLDTRRIEVLQREKQLEQRMYDGRLTLSIVLDDVRVGDELEIAYTTSGLNPVFDGKFVHLAWMSSHRGPVQLYQTRLLAPASRAIRTLKGPADAAETITETAGQRETVFKRQSVPMLQAEAGMSASAWLGEQVQFSEFADWAAVADWGDKLFRQTTPSATVRQRALDLATGKTDPADRVVEALRVVQQEVRYFGVEVGVSTHRPHPPEQVLQQRYGDCKDKVTLLTALLAPLDVAMQPVLVSTRLRDEVSRMLPSPLAFDHVIGRVDVAGQTRYLDPTRTHQTGALAARQTLGMGRGLVLAPGSAELIALPAAQGQDRFRVVDHVKVSDFAAAPLLESRVTYRGDLADMVREAVATQGLTPFVDNLTQAYVRAYPSIKRKGSAVLEPVPDDDAVTLVQQFEVPEFWRFPEQRVLVADIVLWGPVDWLLPPKAETRRTAMAYAFPGVYRHQVRVDFADEVFAQPNTRQTDDGDPHFKLLWQARSGGKQAQFDAEVRIEANRVEPAQWTPFTTALGKALPKLGSSLSVQAFPLARSADLMARAKQMEEDLRRGRLKAVTAVQNQSHFKALLLDTQLDGGRLNPALRAQALVSRGIALDQLGRLKDAQRDFEQALQLQPASVEALRAAAVNAHIRGDNDKAVDWATQALQAQPRDPQALYTRGMAHYFAKRFELAQQDWDAALQDGDTRRRGYALIWRALLARRLDANSLPALAAQHPREFWPTEWPRPLLDMAFEAAPSDTALQAAKQSKSPLDTQTEAHFFMGERWLIEGQTSKAEREWKRAVELGVLEFVEFNAAQLRLGGLR